MTFILIVKALIRLKEQEEQRTTKSLRLIYSFQLEKGFRRKKKRPKPKIRGSWLTDSGGKGTWAKWNLVHLKMNNVWLLAHKNGWNLIDMVFAIFQQLYYQRNHVFELKNVSDCSRLKMILGLWLSILIKQIDITAQHQWQVNFPCLLQFRSKSNGKGKVF